MATNTPVEAVEPEPTPEPTPAPRKPFSIDIAAPGYAALSELVLHARAGYTVSNGRIEFQPNGWAFFSVHLGDPEEYVIKAAKESVQLSSDREEAERQKEIQAAARQMIEDDKRAEAERQIAALRAENAIKIARIEAESALAIAALKL